MATKAATLKSAAAKSTGKAAPNKASKTKTPAAKAAAPKQSTQQTATKKPASKAAPSPPKGTAPASAPPKVPATRSAASAPAVATPQGALAEGDWRRPLLAGRRRQGNLPRRLRRQKGRPLFLPEGRHLRLHEGGDRLHRLAGQIRQGEDRRRRHVARLCQEPRQIPRKIRAWRLPLAADETKATLLAYGVWAEKSMYGRKYIGVERSTFLLDDAGRIARIWRKVKVPGHAEEVLAAAQAL